MMYMMSCVSDLWCSTILERGKIPLQYYFYLLKSTKLLDTSLRVLTIYCVIVQYNY